jgi:hypothetical protein
MSMCRVRGVGFCDIAIAVRVSLPSYPIVAAHCETPRSHMTLRQYNTIRPTIAASINSASVEDMATVGIKLALYPTAPPASIIVPPPIERRVNGHIAHTASMKRCISNGPWCGRPSSSRSCMLLSICDGGVGGKDRLGSARQ